MKNFIVLEVNSKNNMLAQIEIDTPNEFLLVNDIEPIMNNRIFEDFMDEIYYFITEELVNEFDEKIDNVYVTFIDNDDAFICSFVLNKIKPKKGTYNLSVINWRATGNTFKYVESNIEQE